ncbi:hypothetical protein IAU60_005829 [Kwoniella sp. DSM 27419]
MSLLRFNCQALPKPCVLLTCDPGSVLIDAFDSAPRLCTGAPAPTAGRSVVEQPAPLIFPDLSNIHKFQRSPVPARVATPLASPAGSGPTTPQLTLDEFPEPDPSGVIEMLGGGAYYALVGARIWLPPRELRTLVDRAPESELDDLSSEGERTLRSIGSEIWCWNRRPGTRMTRARIRYEGEVRLFHSVVKAPHRSIAELSSTPLYGAEYLHVSPPYSPEEVMTLLKEIGSAKRNARADVRSKPWIPKLVFEPTPASCHAGQREWLERILPGLHVLSPNHEELLSLYSIPKTDSSDPKLKSTVERLVRHLLYDVGIGEGGQGIIVIRCAWLGACVGTRQGGLKWCPAFFQRGSDRVKDVTGAGNSFLGGYVAGLSLTNDPYEASLYATVSASFTVEQFGIPSLDSQESGERWNGETPHDRLEDLRRRAASGASSPLESGC